MHVLEAANIAGEDLKAACRACETFVSRSLRVGTGENDYDHAREPLCFHIADDLASVQYVYQPGTAGDDVDTLARGFCDCPCPTAYDGTVNDNTDQTDFTDELGRTRHGFEHNTYSVHLDVNPDGTFTPSGTFTHDALDAFAFDGNPGERCTSTETRHGTGTVIGYTGGTLMHPAGTLEAMASVTTTNAFSPCMGQPGGMDQSTSDSTFFVDANDITPTFAGGCLVGLTWDFHFFDPASNTTDSQTGSVTGTP